MKVEADILVQGPSIELLTVDEGFSILIDIGSWLIKSPEMIDTGFDYG